MNSTPNTDEIIRQINDVIAAVSIRDAKSLRASLKTFERQVEQGAAVDDLAESLIDQAVAAVEWVERRKRSIPDLNYNETLPVTARREEIVDIIRRNQVVIIAGETGSGKTTQLPKMCLEAGCGIRGIIGHTQPRRLAARTIAQRLSEELGVELGAAVGYQVRFTDQTSSNTLIKQMTDGILLAETQNDRLLSNYDTIIIDEAHERSLNIDFLLGYIKLLLDKRPDLKVIITSATIDVERFSQHFNNAPVVIVEGRTFPVTEVYMGDAAADDGLPGQVLAAIDYIERDERSHGSRMQGDVLVFLPGERDIREVALRLKRELQQTDVLPLYARLEPSEQRRIFDLSKRRGRRIVLATNVAETSVTVPGIRYVIDSGLVRMSRYSVRSKIQRLPIEDISQASANQRKGRCGRVAEGVCIRLYSEESFARRPEFTEPEILRTNLAAVILQMMNLRLGDIRHFPFVEQPDDRLINDGYKTLLEISAVDRKHHLTDIGKQLSKLPVDPRIGRILLAAAEQGSLTELLIIASALSGQDPRERPAAKQAQADQAHARFNDKESDFGAWLNLWRYLEDERQALSKTQFNKQCKREFLAPLRVAEWRDIHHQLVLAVKSLGLRLNSQAAGYEAIHKPLLAGFPGQMGVKEDGRQFKGARNREFIIFPGSNLYKKPPMWIVAAELTETSKLHARSCAGIEPAWVLDYAEHLVKRHYSEPHWKTNQGQVVAKETINLYGLVIAENPNIPYGQKDPELARELFLRQALVERNLRSKADFWRNNETLLDELEALEKKTRSADYHLDDEWLYQFYAALIPEDVYSQRHLEAWLKQDPARDKALAFKRSDVIRSGNISQDQQNFPDHLVWQDLKLPLSYEFSPGRGSDGVTVTLPVGVLNRVPVALFDWLVPGLLFDKCVALLKGLPKTLRKNLVPVPATVEKLLPDLRVGDYPLTEALAAKIKQQFRLNISAADWNIEALAPLYRMRVRIVAADNSFLAEGYDIEALINEYRGELTQQIKKGVVRDEIFTDWVFKPIVSQQTLRQSGVDIKAFPALVDQGDKVKLSLLDDAPTAARAHRLGSARLFMLKLSQQMRYLRKELLKTNDCMLHFSVLCERKPFVEAIIQAAVIETFGLSQHQYRSPQEFERALNANKAELINTALRIEKAMAQVLASHYHIHKQLLSLTSDAWRYAVDDVRSQLNALLADGFIVDTVDTGLYDYPRYFKALEYRVDKLSGHFQKDKQATQLLAVHQQRMLELKDRAAADKLRWMIEEYRVSLFAQHIKTKMPVSEKRLNSFWQDVKA